MSEQAVTKKKPHAQLLRRRNIEGAVWRNEDNNGVPFYVAGVTRSYRDRDKQWRNDTLYVPLDDIPRVIALLQEAETRMYEQLQTDYEATRDENTAAA